MSKRTTKNPPGHLSANNGVSNSQPPQKITVTETHFGPIPHPQILARYDEILPGAAERILKMAKKKQPMCVKWTAQP